MKDRNRYLLIALLAVVITGCRQNIPGESEIDTPQSDSKSVITMVTGRADRIISLSVDASVADRSGVWIDLDGDGLRAEDGREEVKEFNAYREYNLAEGVRMIPVYGDITYLAAASNELTTIDISGNSYLTTLNVPLNNLSAINLSQNRVLRTLDISDNKLTALDVSANSALLSLWAFNNKLTAIDVSKNSLLSFLDCSGNELGSLDISGNAQLTQLLAYNNRLTGIDISQNPLLNRLWLFGNPLENSEKERLASNLRSVADGDFWFTDEPL